MIINKLKIKKKKNIMMKKNTKNRKKKYFILIFIFNRTFNTDAQEYLPSNKLT